MLLAIALVLGAAQEEGERKAADLFSSGPSAPRLQAVEPAYRHNLTRPDYIDRRTVADLAVGTLDLAHAGLRDDGGDAWAARGIKWGLSFWFGIACTHVVHEYGHVSSLSRCGVDTALLGAVGGDPEEREDATLGRLFVQGLWPTEGRALSMRDEDWLELRRKFEGRPRDLNRFWLGVEAGGLNQEQVFVTRYAERLQEGRLSYLDTPTVLWASLGTILYSATVEESDIADYIDRLRDEGRDVSASRLKALTLFRFVGGSGLASLQGGLQGAFGSAGDVVQPLATEALEDVHVHWPEFESFLTRSGPTLKASVPLRAGEWRVLPSYERSFASGPVDHEAGLRARAPFFDGLVWLDGALYGSDQGGVWRSGEVELRPVEWLSLLLGGEEGRGYTFRRDVFGSRETFMDGSERSLIAGLRINLAF